MGIDTFFYSVIMIDGCNNFVTIQNVNEMDNRMKRMKKRIARTEKIAGGILALLLIPIVSLAAEEMQSRSERAAGEQTAGIGELFEEVDIATTAYRNMPEEDSAVTETEGVARIFGTLDDISDTEWDYLAYCSGEAVELGDELYFANDPVAVTHWGYRILGVCSSSQNVNIFESADTGSKCLGQLPPDAGCEILEDLGEWFRIESGNVKGFIRAEYILTEEAARERAEEVQVLSATVTARNLKVRKQPNTSCGVRGMVKRNSVWTILEEIDGWVKITYDNEAESYLSKDYVQVGYMLESALTMTEVRYGRGVTDVGIDIAEYAVQFVGNPYVYGGTSLTKGADCSGFTLTIFKKYGVSLSHSARAQSKCGTPVAISELRPGDLVFYSNETGINHVTIYIGNGQVCHASSPETGIKISKLHYRTPTCARRLIE